MKSAATCLLLCGLLCSAATLRSASRPTGTIYGVGNHSCGKWLATEHDSDEMFINHNWVLGWISAADHYAVHGGLRETDADAIVAWMDNYCRERPLKSVDDAAAALVRELAKPQ